MSEHISKQFDQDLETIRSNVLQMGGLVERQIAAAIDAFIGGDLAKLDEVVAGDAEVDRLEMLIDEECTRLIVRRQPAANDLRLIFSVTKMVTDLERIGDKAAKIARQGRQYHLGDRRHTPRLPGIRHLADLAVGMLHRALDAMARQDAEAARALIADDRKVDDSFSEILRQLITYMMEDPRTISRCLDVVWIAKAIERVGDHAANIAEGVVYTVQGKDIRHTAPEASQPEV